MPLHLPALGRAAASAALGGAILLGTAATASAHVTVHPDSTVAGDYTQLTFRVPTESPKASTTKLVVTLPQDTPLASVSIKPVNGWTASITEAKLPAPIHEEGGATLTKAPHVVTWKATTNSAAIAPGQYQEFSVSAGPLPKSGTLSFPATQYYSDGTVVRWNQHTKGSAEPEHPAPAFTIGGADQQAAAAANSAGPTVTSASNASSSDNTSRWISGAALVVALIAAGLAGTAVGRGQRRRAPRASSATEPGSA